jgi:hypothetical protein
MNQRLIPVERISQALNRHRMLSPKWLFLRLPAQALRCFGALLVRNSLRNS